MSLSNKARANNANHANLGRAARDSSNNLGSMDNKDDNNNKKKDANNNRAAASSNKEAATTSSPV